MEHILIEQEKTLSKKNRISIGGILIDPLTMQETINLVEEYIEQKIPLHLMGVNADKINSAQKNDYLKEIINKCGIINADGASAVMASNFLKKPLPERVAGIDLMQELVKKSEEKGYKIFLLGAKQEIVEKTVGVLTKQYPNLEIAGFRNGYFDETEWDKVAQNIKNVSPDIVFVGITSPLKEYLIEYLQDKGINSVLMGVGGSFDVISGKIPRAPQWVQNLNLEWLFRVAHEPRRLFKRYFVGNSQFLKLVLKEKNERK